MSTATERTARLAIDGMTCASCSSIIERTLGRMDGVESMAVNLAANSGTVTYDPGAVSLDAVLETIDGLGFSAEVVPDESRAAFDELFAAHPAIGGIAVFNSRSYVISDYLRRRSLRDIRLVGYGMIERNLANLREGYISYLLAERPDKQGYLAVRAILEYELFSKRCDRMNYTPVDILIRENVDYYLRDMA